MFRSPLFFLSLVVIFFSGCRKDLLHWQKVQKLTSNTTARLDNVRFVGNNICIAAGGVQFLSSEILRSVDGGYTWSVYSDSNAPKELFGMNVTEGGDVYLCGVDGDVLHSHDSGRTWKFGRAGDWLPLVGGTFTTRDTGIFVSTTLQRQCTIVRVDSNFKTIDEKTYPFGLNNIYIATPVTGYVVGYGVVMKTIDRGATWNFQDVAGDNFTAMDIRGAGIWMCGENGSIYHSSDGTGWQELRNGNDITHPHYSLRCILFKDELHGWAAGDDGKVIYSDDGGNHWMEYDQFTTSALRSMALCPNGDLLVVGDGGVIFRILPQ